MNRRGFLQLMVGGVATAAAVRTFPFRVYSFPTEVKLVTPTTASLFQDVYATGQSKNFAQLLAPGLRGTFLKWLESSNPVEYRYGFLGEPTTIGISGEEVNKLIRRARVKENAIESFSPLTRHIEDLQNTLDRR